MRLQISENEPLFKMCVVKERVYPTLAYLASIKAGNSEMVQLLDEIHKNYFCGDSNPLRYLREDKKWGFITSLFQLKRYRVLYAVTKRRSI
jgi:hypothetical protein